MAVASTQQQGRAPLADTLATWLYKRFGSGRTPRRTAWDLSTKADPVGGLVVSSYGLTQPVRTPRRFDTLAVEGYQSCPPVFRAVSIIASACAGIPWQVYTQRGNSGGAKGHTLKGHSKHGQQIDQHPLLDLLARPNPDTGGAKLMEAYVSYLYIAGNSYLWANRPGNGGKSGAPVELWTMRPDRMRVLPDAKQFVGGYTYEVNGQRIDFDRASMLHTKTFAPLDDWYGMSPLVVAARAIDIRNAGGDWNLALLQNSGKLPGFFVSKERLGDTQFERMREQLLDRYTGSRNVGLPGLLDGGDITWTPNGITPLDMDWGNLTREEGRDIAMTLGVPSELLGDSTNKTYSNFSEARASLYTETVLPLMDMIRDDLNRWLVPMFDTSLYLDYDREDIEALQEERGRLYQWVSMASFLTVNEKRDILSYPQLPAGNVIIMPVASATLEDIAHGEDATNGGTGAPVKPPTTPTPPPTGRPNDEGGGDDGSAPPTPTPDGATPDGGMAAAVDTSAKAAVLPVYDPLDDLLAGKVVTFHPKAVRRLTVEEKAAQWQQAERARTPWYKSVAEDVRQHLRTEHTAVMAAIVNANTAKGLQAAADKAVDAQADAWTHLLTSIHQDVGAAFAKDTYTKVLKLAKDSQGQRATKRARDTVALVDDWHAHVVHTMLTTGAAKVKGITDTTRQQIQDALAQGVADEETIYELTQRLDNLYLDQIIPNRSETISRTEVVSASNSASIFGARDTGLNLDKTWIATQDGRTRPDHADADGQQVGLADNFVVGGVEMDVPGNSGDPEQDINCRCTVGYVVLPDNASASNDDDTSNE